MLTSGSFDFNLLDFKKWLNNTLIFLAPITVIYLGFVVNNIKSLGGLENFTWSVFAPTAWVWGATSLYIVNTLFDLITKFVKDNTK